MFAMKPMLSRIPEDLHARVKAEAAERGVSMSHVVIEALEMYLASVFLAARMDSDPGKVVFSIRQKELHKLRSFDEVIEEVIKEQHGRSDEDNPETRLQDGEGLS